jgi:hypothetical protein
LFGDNHIGLGSLLCPLDVPVGQPRRQRPGSDDLRQVEVSIDGECPGHPDRFRRGTKVALRQAIRPAAQSTFERPRLQGGNRHALAGNGVEAAHGVTENQQTRRE